MASNQTRAQARRGELTFSSTTTDAPILPVDQIERLAQVAPHRVDWVFEQTEKESDFRRNENRRINTMLFVERLAGLIFALLVAIMGLGLAGYLAMEDRTVVASIVGGTTLVGLVTAFILGRHAKPQPK